jgi:hypothetical protein
MLSARRYPYCAGGTEPLRLPSGSAPIVRRVGVRKSCIVCHMPRSPNEQVPHTATTLHLISRFADRVEPVTDLRRQSNPPGVPLIHFHRDQLDADERSAVARDLGIALATSSRSIPGWSTAAVSRMALPLLETSLKARPADGPAWEANRRISQRHRHVSQRSVAYQYGRDRCYSSHRCHASPS